MLLARRKFIVGAGASLITSTRGGAWSRGSKCFLSASIPSITAQAAYAIDGATGCPLYSRLADTAFEYGSVTKLLTAILLCRNVSNLSGTNFTAVTADLNHGSFNIPLMNGDILSALSCLQGMIIPSANDAAQCIGRSIGNLIDGGGLVTFVALMNSFAAALGCKNTTFLEPQGGGSAGSAKDIVILMAEAMKYSPIVTVMQTGSVTISISGPNARNVPLNNINPLFGNTGVIAGKTGDPAGQTYKNFVIVWDTVGGNRTILANLASTNDTTRTSDMNAIIGNIPSAWHWTGGYPVPGP